MGVKTVTLTGWGQPYQALAQIIPEASHIPYVKYMNIRDALSGIAEQAQDADVVIGWSLGGQLAVRAILAGLINPKKLVLIATPFQFVEQQPLALGMDRAVYEKFYIKMSRNPERTLNKAWELVVKGDDQEERVREYLSQQDPEEVLADQWLRWLNELDNYSLHEVNMRSLPPVLLLHGTNDVVVASEQSEHFADILPNATLRLMEGCGHAPHWHNLDQVKIHVWEYLGV